MHRRAAQRQERLRITAPPTFARQILVPALEGFARAHPRIELEIVLSVPYLGHSLPDHGAGLEVTHGASADAGDAGEVLMHDRVLPMAAPSLLERLGRPREPSGLAALPLLRTPIEPWRPWLRAAGLDWPEPAHGPRLVDLGLTLEAAACGQGVALARPTLARAWLAAGSLVPLFALSTPAAHHYLLRPHAGEGAAAAVALWLQETCAACERAAADWLSGLT